MSLEYCIICGKELLSEADPYVYEPLTQKIYHPGCWFSYELSIETAEQSHELDHKQRAGKLVV
jgi:hypothetical protein